MLRRQGAGDSPISPKSRDGERGSRMARKSNSKREPARPLTKDEFAGVLSVLSEETDRGCVLAIESLFTDALEIMIRRFFDSRAIISPGVGKDKESKEWLALTNEFFFARGAVLGTFFVRIDTCRLLGLLNHQWRDALHEFREMRNKAAHGRTRFRLSGHSLPKMRSILSVTDKKLILAVEESSQDQRFDIPKPRIAFQLIALAIYVRLMLVASNIDPTFRRSL